MSWDVKLTRPNGQPLGSVESVQKAILAILPETRFHRDGGGQEKIAEVESRGIELPEALRNVFAKMPATIKGEYGKEQDGLWLQFFLGGGGDLKLLHVAVKGGNEVAELLLNRLASRHGWELSNYGPADTNNGAAAVVHIVPR